MHVIFGDLKHISAILVASLKNNCAMFDNPLGIGMYLHPSRRDITTTYINTYTHTRTNKYSKCFMTD